jgi:hypothetical protein
MNNEEWVDRLTWRLHRLVKLIKDDSIKELRSKALNQMKQTFWSPNMAHYRISSGIIPQVMQIKMSQKFYDILE